MTSQKNKCEKLWDLASFSNRASLKKGPCQNYLLIVIPSRNIKDENLVLPYINPSNFESVLNWRKFWRVCMGCYQTLIPHISIGNCNSELIFGMRASFRILCKNMTSYPIISKILCLWRHHFRTLWIFSLSLGSKQRNRWHKTGHFAIQESTRAQNHV